MDDVSRFVVFKKLQVSLWIVFVSKNGASFKD